jgi:hypothetical protein
VANKVLKSHNVIFSLSHISSEAILDLLRSVYLINANNDESLTHIGAAWTADAQRQGAIGMEFCGSTRANQIRYDGSMEAIKAWHDATTEAARLHAVGSVYSQIISAGASQMQSVMQQFNRY